MKILYLPSWYPPDGGSFFVNQIESLSKKGIEASVIYSRNIIGNVIHNPFEIIKIFQPKLYKDNDLKVYQNNYISIPKFKYLPLKLYSIACDQLFRKYLSENGYPDLIHVHSCLWGGYAAKNISEKYGIPFIITEHRGRFTLMNDLAKNQVKEWYTPILSKVFNESSGVILVGGHLYNGLSKYYDKNEIFTEVIPNGIYTDFFKPLYTNNNNCFVFTTVTSLLKLKGIDWLLRSFAAVLKRIEEQKVTLNIVGDGPEKKSLKQLVQNLKIENNVVFHGKLDSEGVRKHLQQSDAFIFPSRFEAQGVAYLEALSSGLPVICSEAIPAECFKEFMGYRVEIDNMEQLSESIYNMVMNYGEFDSKKIRNYAVNEYDFERVAGRIIKFYHKALQQKNA